MVSLSDVFLFESSPPRPTAPTCALRGLLLCGLLVSLVRAGVSAAELPSVWAVPSPLLEPLPGASPRSFSSACSCREAPFFLKAKNCGLISSTSSSRSLPCSWPSSFSVSRVSHVYDKYKTQKIWRGEIILTNDIVAVLVTHHLLERAGTVTANSRQLLSYSDPLLG